MLRMAYFHAMFVGGLLFSAITSVAFAANFNIPSGELETALDGYMKQSGIELMYSDTAVKGIRSNGARGELSADDALVRILKGTGFVMQHRSSGAITIVRDEHASVAPNVDSMSIAAASVPTTSGAALETVTVTSSKIGGDVQNIPISITALSQEQLTATQTTGGPDLVKQVPNLTFSKTNFTGYNIEIRGIGTQAISVATDPAVAVAFNDTPFIRNHFFEQEFYDVSQVEILRGPQGTLYGRNATAGVVNLVSARPSDQFEMVLSADVGNYSNKRFEGMWNIPVIDDQLDIRAAFEWTKRDGYAYNETLNQRIDGRDLWSGRLTIGFKPFESVQAYLIWEHFGEDDDRMRSTKQLCKKDPGPSSVGDVSNIDASGRAWLSQGCLPVSLYSPEAFETPNGSSEPFVAAGEYQFGGGASDGHLLESVDPYAGTTQSRNLRVIESQIEPTYKAKNDVLELNADVSITPSLTFASQTGFNQDLLASTEDFNRFNTAPGIFPSVCPVIYFACSMQNAITPGFGYTPNGIFCDPQLGCSNRLYGEDLSQEHAWQLSQEFRLASSFGGPFNFSLGANALHYETEEDYYVFINLLTLEEAGVFDVAPPGVYGYCSNVPMTHLYADPKSTALLSCGYIDPNPITHLDGNGHNYFRSQNPYLVNSYAGFGEAYYQVLPDLKLTGGLRWTDDRKHFTLLPSWVATGGWGYPSTGVIDQEWQKITGRAVVNWTPKLDFTDQSMFYASYSHGYKGGGANPPGPALTSLFGFFVVPSEQAHPQTFKPEYNDAFEVGTKNTALDGALTLNGDVFYYDYKGYQISEIVDRSALNLNFDAKVKGAELEAAWEPVPGLRFNLATGFEAPRVDNGQSAIDLMDRTDGNPNWMIVKPFVNASSNCILPTAVIASLISQWRAANGFDNSHSGEASGVNDVAVLSTACYSAYVQGVDPGAFHGFTTGFDPSTAPNGGAGFSKDVGGNELPNAPHVTFALGAQYTMPVDPDWAATLRGDFYLQSDSWARVFNDNPYDRIHGYTNLNLTLILTSQDGWQAMGYMKNVFNTTAITGAFLNSDDTALTTNVFVTDPRLFGIRLTKNW